MKPINLLFFFASPIKKLEKKNPSTHFLFSSNLSSSSTFFPLSIIPIKKKRSNQAMVMSPDTIPSSKPTVAVPNQSSTSSGSRKSGASQKPPDHQQALKCPRCDSPNTKFCYYNNYSLTQPRHFCKTCRRYWTKGGALRNVPIGGGCRKNKKSKTGSRNSDDSCRDSLSGSYDSSSGLKFFHGFTNAAAMEFQLGNRLPFARLNSSSPSVFNQFISFGGDLSSAGATTSTSPTCLNMDASPSSSSLMGFENYPSVLRQQGDHSSSNCGGGIMNWEVQEIGSSTNAAQYNSLASSIESLSCINQDLHWKLQQQRLAMLFGSGENKHVESCVSSLAAAGSISLLENQAQKTQPILFQNMDMPKPEGSAVVNQRKSGIDHDDGANNTSTTAEWFFENPNIPCATTPANSSNNGNGHTSNWGSGNQAWSDLHDQYSALPQ